MLRIGFLPSDFHPLMLMLGEAADFACLAGTLGAFAAGDGEMPLEGTGTAVTLRRGGEPGMRPMGPQAFAWCLQPDQALAFADAAGQLAQPDRLSGSEHLETGAAGEIPVKVSRGEYTDDFLLDDRAALAL